jgi:plastocyanin
MPISNIIRSALIAAGLGAACAPIVAAFVLPTWAQTVSASAISIKNFAFLPRTLTVKAGTTVTWSNKDDTAHGIASSNNAFARSKALNPNDSYSFTFTTPGTYQYFCYIHPQMTGTIVVE